jgi:SPP1 family predicted phage head-tail adaptor
LSIRSNIDARSLDQRITIQAQVHERSSTGTLITSWSTVIECWARMDATMAKERMERMAAAEVNQVNAYTCWVRADIVQRFAITTAMRVMWRGFPFDIQDIPDNTLRGRLTALFLQGGLSKDGS